MGAHDSAFTRNGSNEFSEAGNQFFLPADLLSSGVRLLSAQAHNGSDGSVHLCHTSCLLYDAGPMTEWLGQIKSWLDGNPNDVVSILIVNSDNNDASTFSSIFDDAGITPYAYTPPSNVGPVSWPTLGDMISSGTRLVAWVASLDPSSNTVAPYLLDEFSFIFENQYDVTDASAFSCDSNRPGTDTGAALSAGMLPLMNHFLDDNVFGSGIEVPSVENADNTNAPSGDTGNFGDAANACVSEYNRAPWGTLLDFANVGPAMDVVDSLNGVSGSTTGRTALPTDVADSMAAVA